jgi:hypothetical protein
MDGQLEFRISLPHYRFYRAPKFPLPRICKKGIRPMEKGRGEEQQDAKPQMNRGGAGKWAIFGH